LIEPPPSDEKSKQIKTLLRRLTGNITAQT